MNPFDLAGKVAIVTGGNGGIGFGKARGLAGASAAILIVGRNADKNAAAVEELTQAGARAGAFAADVTKEAECEAIAAAALEQFGRIDILINNAGVNIRKQPEDYTLDEWRSVMDTNLTSAFLCSKAVYPALKREGGKIVNIGSMLSIFGAAFATPYAASKGGIVQLTKSLASAWAKDKIQVNAVLPGWIDTELTREARKSIPILHSRVMMRTPARRWGTPDDLAGTAVFLASRASDFITGAAIPVDGGYAAEI